MILATKWKPHKTKYIVQLITYFQGKKEEIQRVPA